MHRQILENIIRPISEQITPAHVVTELIGARADMMPLMPRPYSTPPSAQMAEWHKEVAKNLHLIAQVLIL